MTLQTNLNVSPYFDDFDENKDYYKVLFKPGVSVQVRELNQLQTILQNQIEKFGDNILKSGSIVSGVNFSFNPNYNYVRISDLDVNGLPTIPSSYVGMFVQSESTNLRARILQGIDGYETNAPDTKTLYIEHVNSGSDGDTSTFASGEILKITNANNSLFAVNINNGGSNFTNNDTVVITSAIAVDPYYSQFNVGDTITQGSNAAVIIAINDQNPFGTSNTYQIFQIAPRQQDLNNLTLTTTPWVFSNGASITNGSAIANVAFSIGRGAAASVVTDSSGYILSIPVTNIGYGYVVLPNISVKPTQSGSGTDTFSADGINYAARIKVPDGVTGSGTGYSMSVTEGYIYQKGYFLKVQAQNVIVNKYNEVALANNVSVVFQTSESIINSNIDTSLLDNILNTTSGVATNANAPGADRIKLVPSLTVVPTSDAYSSETYFSLVDFSEGKPFKQNRYTQYNEIANEMARRTNDEAGSYVLNEFIATSRSPLSSNAGQVSLVVDPGKAYISGYRVETVDNYYDDVSAGIDTQTQTGSTVSLSYGNYVLVSEVGGYFNFNHGDTVLFSNSSVGFVTNSLYSVPNAPGDGNYLAKANIRSVVLENGVPGTASAVYRIYLFNLVVKKGFNLKDARSVYYVPTYDPVSTPAYWPATGVADLVLTKDPVTAANVAVVSYSNNSTLLFNSGTKTTLVNANNVVYTYRTSNNGVSVANTGLLSISYSGSAVDSFPYTSTLSTSQLLDLIVVPSVNLVSSSALTGATTAAVTSKFSNSITATSGLFITETAVGDYLYFTSNNISANINASTGVNGSTEFFTPLGGNPFANGQAVTYYVAVGNTAIGGLSNNATYYVYNGNTTSFQLVTSAGNTSPINVSASVSETGHQFYATLSTATTDLKRVVAVSNNTSLQLNSNLTFTSSSTSVFRVYPKNVPIPFGSRSGLSASVDSTAKTLTANIGFRHSLSTGANSVVSYNVLRTNVAPATKTAVRNIPVAITIMDNPGGVKGPWCLGCPDIFRLRSVIIQQNGSSSDVTKKFYVDHNQNPDFLDLGYLYIDPKSSLALTTDATLLVTFDAFVSTDPTAQSYYVSQSYVGSNTAQQFINDSLDLTALNNTSGIINTNEVPELYSNRNGYYNLLNQIDFRPSALPTINVYATSVNSTDTTLKYSFDTGTLVTSGSIPIRQKNPVSTVLFSNNTTVDLHFPLPDSTLTADLTYYLPRIDNIVVSKDGTIDVIKGSSSLKPKVAAKPTDTLLVNNVYIPDYPSIPKNADSRTLNILNTKMASERYSTRRLKSHIVTNLLSSADVQASQPRGFNMSDIGNMDRRLKEVEYYVGLSLLEANLNKKVIPSVLDPNLDRYKYGYFVDDFSSNKYSDINNPQYSATITLNTLYPLAENLNLVHGNQNNYSLGVTNEQVVVRQDIASYMSPPAPCVIDYTRSYTLVELGRQQLDTVKDSYTAPRFSSTPATATLYFYTYGAPISLSIIQAAAADAAGINAGTKVKSSTDAVPLTDYDVSFLKSKSYFSDTDVVLNTSSLNISGGQVTGAGKIVIPHLPVSGRFYNFQTTKGTGSQKWRWFLDYPIDNSDYIDCFYDTDPVTKPPITVTTTTRAPTPSRTIATTTPVPTTSVTTTPGSLSPIYGVIELLSSGGGVSTTVGDTLKVVIDVNGWSKVDYIVTGAGGAYYQSGSQTATISGNRVATTINLPATVGAGVYTLSYSPTVATGFNPATSSIVVSSTVTVQAVVTTTVPTTTTPVPTTTTPVPTTSTPTPTPTVTPTPTPTVTSITYPNTYLYLKSNGMTLTGTGLVDALNFNGFDALTPPASVEYGGVDITSWTAIKNSSFGVNYVKDTTEDAAGKFRSIYIDSTTVANAIRKDLYNKTSVNYKILEGYGGAALVDAVHGYYTTYMNRIPELTGLYYWIATIVIKGQSLNTVENSIQAIAAGYTSQFGYPFDFRWNNTSVGVDISSYSIPTVSTPSAYTWAFLRPSSAFELNAGAPNVLETMPSTTSGNYSDVFVQYWYNGSLSVLYKNLELFGVSQSTLINGLTQRIQGAYGNYNLSTDNLPALQTIYSWYWNNPTSTSNVDGFGRAPDLDGFTYWVAHYFMNGGDLVSLKNQFFSGSQPEVQYIKSNGTGSTLRNKGLLSTQSTNYIIGTNVTQIGPGTTFKNPTPATNLDLVNAPTNSGNNNNNLTTNVAGKSTGSLTSTSTSSMNVSGTNNNGFIQSSAVKYTAVMGQDGDVLYYRGSDGQDYYRSQDENGNSSYYAMSQIG